MEGWVVLYKNRHLVLPTAKVVTSTNNHNAGLYTKFVLYTWISGQKNVRACRMLIYMMGVIGIANSEIFHNIL